MTCASQDGRLRVRDDRCSGDSSGSRAVRTGVSRAPAELMQVPEGPGLLRPHGRDRVKMQRCPVGCHSGAGLRERNWGSAELRSSGSAVSPSSLSCRFRVSSVNLDDAFHL